MAVKATIFKAELRVADTDRGHYATHAVTIARHPSETDERMMVRLVAFALNAAEGLAFGKGLSTDDEPDLWRKDLSGAIETWIEVGLPDARRLARASGRAREVRVYAYGGRAVEAWWAATGRDVARLANLAVFEVPQAASAALVRLAHRTMRLECTVQEGHVWFGSDAETVTFVVGERKSPAAT